MLENKFLASNLIYLTRAHSKKDIDDYLKAVEKIFKEMKKFGIKNFKNRLKGKVSHSGFQRLN